MEQKDSNDKHLQQGWKMLKEHHDFTAIAAHFKNAGVDEETVETIIRLLKKRRTAERSQWGTVMILAGVLLMGIGFFSSFILHGSNSSISFALYGLTTVGAIILLAGLFFIFH